MRVRKLWIRNFRGFGPGGGWTEGQDIEVAGSERIQLDKNIVFLIGRNNASKSTVLHAYDKYFNHASLMDINDFYNLDTNNDIVIEAEIIATPEELDEADRKWHDDNGIARVRRIWTDPGSKPSKESFNQQECKWVKNGYHGFDSHLQHALPDPIFISGFMAPKEVIDQLNKLLKQAVISRISQTAEYKSLQESIINMRGAIEADGYSQRIEVLVQSQLENIFPHLRVSVDIPEDETKVATLFPSAELNVVEGERRLPLDQHGHGLRRQFILSALHGICHEIKRSSQLKPKEIKETDFSAEPDSAEKVLLFEEPELFLHPHAIRDVRSLLYKIASEGGFQVIAATHSPIMIDLEEDHQSIARTKASDAGARIHQVEFNIFENDEKKQLSMLNRFNPYVHEAFFAERVILVEGDTEQAVLRSLLKEWKDKHSLDVHVLNCGTKNNIPMFQRVLKHFAIEYEVIHDLDQRKNKKGDRNTAWSINEAIWAEIEEARKIGVAARGFVFNQNFESAHGVEEGTWRGKPLQALTEMATWDLDPKKKDMPVVWFLSTILDLAPSMAIFNWRAVDEMAP